MIGLGRIFFQITEDEKQAVFRRREGAVGVGDVAAILARFPLQRPGGHPVLKGGLKWDHQFRKLVDRHAGQGLHFRRVGHQGLIRSSLHAAPP